jgi:hypothetical protein
VSAETANTTSALRLLNGRAVYERVRVHEPVGAGNSAALCDLSTFMHEPAESIASAALMPVSMGWGNGLSGPAWFGARCGRQALKWSSYSVRTLRRCAALTMRTRSRGLAAYAADPAFPDRPLPHSRRPRPATTSPSTGAMAKRPARRIPQRRVTVTRINANPLVKGPIRILRPYSILSRC